MQTGRAVVGRAAGAGAAGASTGPPIMGRNFLPRADAAFGGWSSTFLKGIAAADPATTDVTAADVASYAAAHARFVDALGRTSRGPSRTQIDVADKDDARAELVALSRRLAARVRASAADETLRRTLGLLAEEPRVRRIPRPAWRPTVLVEASKNDPGVVSVLLRDHDAFHSGRRRPGVAGAAVMVHAGPNRPPDPRDWRLAGLTTRLRLRIDVSRDPPGAPVWIVAAWLNPMLETGHFSDLATATVPFNAHHHAPLLIRTAAAA